IHHPLSAFSYQLSAFSCLSVGVNERGCAQPQLSEVNYPLSTVYYPLSTIHCLLALQIGNDQRMHLLGLIFIAVFPIILARGLARYFFKFPIKVGYVIKTAFVTNLIDI